MTNEIICAGFGGQGVMLIGQLIAYAGMFDGKNVSWVPSYGPEMRGGTANCSVVVSDEPVGSPVISEPSGVIVMNQPSLERFLPVIKSGGVLVYNSSLITMKETRDDLQIVAASANDLATELGNSKVANLVVLGAFLQKTKVVTVDGVEKALQKVLPPHRHKLIPLNLEALEKGMALA